MMGDVGLMLEAMDIVCRYADKASPFDRLAFVVRRGACGLAICSVVVEIIGEDWTCGGERS